MEEAKRFNTDKVNFTMLPTAALKAESMVWMMGEKKYGRDNWRKLWGSNTLSVCLASALRHIVSLMEGELFDLESKLPHAAHVRCNMAMIIEWMSREGVLEPKPVRETGVPEDGCKSGIDYMCKE